MLITVKHAAELQRQHDDDSRDSDHQGVNTVGKNRHLILKIHLIQGGFRELALHTQIIHHLIQSNNHSEPTPLKGGPLVPSNCFTLSHIGQETLEFKKTQLVKCELDFFLHSLGFLNKC